MVQLVTRAEWGARPPTSITPATWSQRDAYVQHYSAGPPTQTMRAIQNYHMDTQGWSDIGYNLAVDQNGIAYEGRGWMRVPAATAGHNSHTLAVLFIGRDHDVTAAAKNTLRALYDEACQRAGKTLLQRWHNFYANTPNSGDNVTSCPGAHLRGWVASGMPFTLPGGTVTTTLDDTYAPPFDGVPRTYAKLVEDLWDHVFTSRHEEITPDSLGTRLADLQSRPPVVSAPVDLAGFVTAFKAALDDPDVKAKLVAIVNVAEDS